MRQTRRSAHGLLSNHNVMMKSCDSIVSLHQLSAFPHSSASFGHVRVLLLHIATQRCAVQCGLLLCHELSAIWKPFFMPRICVIVFDFKLPNCSVVFSCLHNPTADLLFSNVARGRNNFFFHISAVLSAIDMLPMRTLFAEAALQAAYGFMA